MTALTNATYTAFCIPVNCTGALQWNRALQMTALSVDGIFLYSVYCVIPHCNVGLVGRVLCGVNTPAIKCPLSLHGAVLTMKQWRHQAF